ncbi:MAG: helix-turn-helix domain-containing protein [Bacteroidota bacterium]
MEDTAPLQRMLFDKMKGNFPPHLSLVDEVSYTLDISTDSAYRRIRGEKILDLGEIKKLCKKYRISMDTLFQVSDNQLMFSHVKVDDGHFKVKAYLEMLLERARTFHTTQDSEMIVIANDITIFQLLQFPELAAFKLFFWQKSSLGFDGFKDQQFSLEDIDETVLNLSKQIVREYNKISTIEIVGIDAVESFLRQIHYYLELGYFKKDSDALVILEKIEELVSHFRKEAEVGYKFNHGTENPSGARGNFTMYYNELFVIDGIVMVAVGSQKYTYIGTGPLNFIWTADEKFYDSKKIWASKLMRSSILVSDFSEKERNIYFKKIEKRIHKFRAMLD